MATYSVLTPDKLQKTVGDLLTAYEREYLPSKALTTQYQQRRLFMWLRQELGFMLLTDLTPAFLRQWRDILSKRYAPGTVRRYMTALSTPLAIAVKDYEWLDKNPLDQVKKPSEPPGRVRFLSDEEREKLLAACAISRNPHLYTLVLLALSTGARKEELRQLRWRDLDLERGVMRISRSKNKTKRSIPLLGPVLLLLRTCGIDQSQNGWVFARHDGLQPLFCDHAWVTACTRAGLVDCHFHDLRHTAASYLAMGGASLREIAEVLGHKKLEMTMRYSHLTDSHVKGVLERLTSRLFGPPDAPAAPPS